MTNTYLHRLVAAELLHGLTKRLLPVRSAPGEVELEQGGGVVVPDRLHQLVWILYVVQFLCRILKSFYVLRLLIKLVEHKILKYLSFKSVIEMNYISC